jgi:hypothetical protein
LRRLDLLLNINQLIDVGGIAVPRTKRFDTDFVDTIDLRPVSLRYGNTLVIKKKVDHGQNNSSLDALLPLRMKELQQVVLRPFVGMGKSPNLHKRIIIVPVK